MRLIELEPRFLQRVDDTHWQWCDAFTRADGIEFLCPKCFAANGNTNVGTHIVICWQPHVPQTTSPTPGRWSFHGHGVEDLTLRAQSSSVLLHGGCAAHFFIEGGEIRMCE